LFFEEFCEVQYHPFALTLCMCIWCRFFFFFFFFFFFLCAGTDRSDRLSLSRPVQTAALASTLVPDARVVPDAAAESQALEDCCGCYPTTAQHVLNIHFT
jgi:hypothetical protein